MPDLWIANGTGGTSDPPVGVYDYPQGSVATVEAIPDSGYEFDYWVVDRATDGGWTSEKRYSKTIDIVMDVERRAACYFKYVGAPSPKITLNVSPTSGNVEDTIKFSGKATLDGEPQGGQDVTIATLAGDPLAHATTNTSGEYEASWTADITGTFSVRAIAMATESDSVEMYIGTQPSEPSGKVTAIRVQDIARQIWYNWDNGSWDAQPEVQPGSSTLYIGAWAENQGDATGDLTLKIEDDMGNILASKTQTVAAGSGFGVEAPDLNMPNRNYGISVSISP